MDIKDIPWKYICNSNQSTVGADISGGEVEISIAPSPPTAINISVLCRENLAHVADKQNRAIGTSRSSLK